MSHYARNYAFLAQLSQWGAISTSLTTIFLALSIVVLSTVFRSQSDDKIHKLHGLYIVNAWSFCSKRYNFLRENFKKTGVKMFRFSLLQHRVIAMAGEANRKIFFNNRSLDISEGYRILSGGIPRLEDVELDGAEARDMPESMKTLLLLLRKERVNEVLPLLLKDINNKTKDWGNEGKMNPFDETYDLVFQMTVRMASCRELSEDKTAISQLAKLYWEVEENVTPVTILLPWFPGSAKKAKQKATRALYNIFLSYINLRRKVAIPSNDSIDLFIAQGISDHRIVEVIMSMIAVGVVNTGVNSSWALLHLGANSKWKRKAIDEYKALVDKYTDTTSLTEPLLTRFSTIPLNAWEDELPSLDLIIRETLRISGSSTFLRRNVAKDIQVGDATIRRGDFVAYSGADVNLNPDIYTNPMAFDPDRYGPGREEDRKEVLGYLSWGAGRHPCAGIKIAKLEIKLILAVMLLAYDYQLVDGNGNYPKAIPDQDRNDLLQSRPMGEPCYLKFKRIVE